MKVNNWGNILPHSSISNSSPSQSSSQQIIHSVFPRKKLCKKDDECEEKLIEKENNAKSPKEKGKRSSKSKTFFSNSSNSHHTDTLESSSIECDISSPSSPYTNVFLEHEEVSPSNKAYSQSSSKAHKDNSRQHFWSSKSDSMNSRSSLEYQSTTRLGDYDDIQYKVSVDQSLKKTDPFEPDKSFSRTKHYSFRDRDKSMKQKWNIHTNPGYDERYGSNKSINNEGVRLEKSLKRYRKSTSDLTNVSNESLNFSNLSSSRPSSPKCKSPKGGLSYLASRRESRSSIVSDCEDIGPLNSNKPNELRKRRTSNFLELPIPDHIRPRVNSLPSNSSRLDDLYRLRTFSITNKGGVVNCGDSIINRKSRSNTSVNSTTSRVSGERSPFDGSCCGSGYHTVESSPLGSSDDVEVPKYRIVLLGQHGVGKTALVSQFMTSEYMNTYDASLDEEFGERTVSVLLDGEESEMVFIDHPSSEMSVENSLTTYEPHACIVVYSITEMASFTYAEETLNYLWREGYTKEKSVIVVGNKADLARARVINTNDGKSLAISRDCKFIETSSGIQHNVDELLVGILKQIRLREAKNKKKLKVNKSLHGSKTSLRLNIARELLQKICMNDICKSKSCENLHVL